jgi:hypothetical protein
VTLIVENNTGLATADSYGTVAELRTYATNRGIEGPADATDDECEIALRKGFDYVNTRWRYKATPISNDQAGEFPRLQLSDGMGRLFDTVPARVKSAQFEAAILSLGGVDLYQNLDRGGQVQSETVGPLSTTYFAGAPAAQLFEAIENFLKPFVKCDGEPYSPRPFFNDPATDPVFSVGMDDNPESGASCE